MNHSPTSLWPNGPPESQQQFTQQVCRVPVFYLSYLFCRKKWNMRLHSVVCGQYHPQDEQYIIFLCCRSVFSRRDSNILRNFYLKICCICVSCGHTYISCIKKPYRKCRFLGYFGYKRDREERLHKDASHRLIRKKIILDPLRICTKTERK